LSGSRLSEDAPAIHAAFLTRTAFDDIDQDLIDEPTRYFGTEHLPNAMATILKQDLSVNVGYALDEPRTKQLAAVGDRTERIGQLDGCYHNRPLTERHSSCGVSGPSAWIDESARALAWQTDTAVDSEPEGRRDAAERFVSKKLAEFGHSDIAGFNHDFR
jgi:hypothetical protein